VPRLNPYLIDRFAWTANQGWLTAGVRCRIDGQGLDARTEVVLSRLELARAQGRDEAQSRIGLPLDMIVALMEDDRGEIRIALPITGALNDPRFDLKEAAWSAVRGVALTQIATPVSWIARVDYSADRRIDRIDPYPVPFRPGSARLGGEALVMVERLAAFLQETPDVRMGLVAVVTPADRTALARGGTREGGPPATPAGAVTAAEPGAPRPDDRARPSDLAELAERRLAAVRDAILQAGIDGDRLVTGPPVTAEAGEGHVKPSLLEPPAPRGPERGNPVRRLIDAVGDAVTGD
jgi:hypothetical protein